MSDDPETVRQMSALSDFTRPLLVVDVDEVVLEFVHPFMCFLDARGHRLRTDSFRLTGNVVDSLTDKPASTDAVETFIEDFFTEQERWQTPVAGAVETLRGLNENMAIVMLTAMPHRHHRKRRALLDEFGLPYPLLTTETAKGPAIKRMRREPDRPVAFVDDIPGNLLSVRNSVPDAALFHLMSFEPFRAVLPQLPEGIVKTGGWHDAGPRIERVFGIASHASQSL